MNEETRQQPRVAPARWPGNDLAAQPGDLEHFAPMGFILGGPPVVRPWDTDLSAVFSRRSYYGAQAHDAHPFRGAPTTDPAGGTVYFRGDQPRENLVAALRLMGVRVQQREFAFFTAEAAVPVQERYLVQARIVSLAALEGLFAVALTAETEPLVRQTLSIEEAVWAFIEGQRARWEDGYAFPAALQGALGGDGDWAKEALAFGFMVENSDWGIYRVWSRAWLVTK